MEDDNSIEGRGTPRELLTFKQPRTLQRKGMRGRVEGRAAGVAGGSEERRKQAVICGLVGKTRGVGLPCSRRGQRGAHCVA